MKKYLKRLDRVEKDLLKLKKESGYGMPKHSISLKGILSGIEITDKEIEQAKKSLFKQLKT